MSIILVPSIGPLTLTLKRAGLLSYAGNITQSISVIPRRIPSMIPKGLVIVIPLQKHVIQEAMITTMTVAVTL
jgi:hypothetical protein